MSLGNLSCKAANEIQSPNQLKKESARPSMKLGVSIILWGSGYYALLARSNTRNCHQPQGRAEKDYPVFWHTSHANLWYYVK